MYVCTYTGVSQGLLSNRWADFRYNSGYYIGLRLVKYIHTVQFLGEPSPLLPTHAAYLYHIT